MYDVFISYCTENVKQAEAIRKDLESSGFVCWFAPLSMHGNRDFTDEIPKAIKNSKAFLLLMSEAAQSSKWVKRELGTADDWDVPIYTLFLEDFEVEDKFKFVLRFNQHYSVPKDGPEAVKKLIAELRDDLSNPAAPASGKPAVKGQAKKKTPVAIIAVVLAVVVALVGVGAFFICSGDDGYVVWCPAHNTALSGKPANNAHYLAGDQVTYSKETLKGYSPDSIWQITFESDNIIIISRDGLNLGVEPGYKGVGLGGGFTADRWELVESDGYYLIRNTETQSYLEWYAEKNNWACHDKITDENRPQFLLRYDKVS